MRIVYIADDGKEFDDEIECERYEWLQAHQNLKYIRVYNRNGDEFEDILAENTYFYCTKIIAPTDLAAKDLRDFSEYTGYCYYDHITEAGTWVFDEKAERFIKEGE